MFPAQEAPKLLENVQGEAITIAPGKDQTGGAGPGVGSNVISLVRTSPKRTGTRISVARWAARTTPGARVPSHPLYPPCLEPKYREPNLICGLEPLQSRILSVTWFSNGARAVATTEVPSCSYLQPSPDLRIEPELLDRRKQTQARPSSDHLYRPASFNSRLRGDEASLGGGGRVGGGERGDSLSLPLLRSPACSPPGSS